MIALTSASGCVSTPGRHSSILVNDIHTRLNPTFVRSISKVRSKDELASVINRAGKKRCFISIAGGRHASGGQQFAAGGELVDTRALHKILQFDSQTGTLNVEAGIQWPKIMAFLLKSQPETPAWTIAQKQTGADRLSIGGALSANIHGRGLQLPPFINQIESFVLLDANGDSHECSRRKNADLFKLAIGGYGLFGFIYCAKLRLAPRRKVRRVVSVIDATELPAAFEQRVREGFLYGDFQFAINSRSDDFLRRGILSCYEPVADDTFIPPKQRSLSAGDWKELIYLAHTDPARGFEKYSQHYLSTSGQIYLSDTQYVSDYFDDYHRELDSRLGATAPATEVLGELFVPRAVLPRFLAEASEDLRRNDSSVIYGTIRLIEKDDESFLAWARQPYAGVIFNLHTPHTPQGQARTGSAFRQLIDRALQHQGSFYLTYHRYATREQVLTCYPEFPEFLRRKLAFDPDERFQSDWYNHYKKLFA